MDPTMLSILTGIVSNALTPLLSHLVSGLGRSRTAQYYAPNAVKILSRFRPSLDERIGKALQSYARNQDRGFLLNENLKAFVQTPEVTQLVLQIYTSRLSSVVGFHRPSLPILSARTEKDDPPGLDKDRSRYETLELQLARMLILHRCASQEDAPSVAKPLLALLWSLCEEALKEAISSGVLEAHEAKSCARHSTVLERLESIDVTLAILKQTVEPDFQQIVEYENVYRAQTVDRYKLVAPPQYESNKRVPIRDVYVEQNFFSIKARTNIDYARPDLIAYFHRIVVLGQPGGGKSTFMYKLIDDCGQELPLTSQGSRPTPILITLKDYGLAKQQRQRSIADFIEETARSHQQTMPPPGALNYLLRSGRAVVLFDGLDELLDTGMRREIVSDVEAFCNYYPAVRVVVTSRERGYEQAPLTDEKFEVFRLAPLGAEQIRQYVVNMLRLEETVGVAEETEMFLRDARSARDLLENPLMLGLLINLYQGARSIPKGRPQVFQKCADMLFTRWDAKRRIEVSLKFREHLEPAVAYLAHWIFTRTEARNGMSEERLSDVIFQYIHPKLFEDPEEARHAARGFIEFCTGRAWVFSDTGTKAAGEKLFEFTHRTFLEYFTALHLCRNHTSPDRLLDVLKPRIGAEEWDMVGQLAFQQISRTQEGAGDSLVEGLLGSVEGEPLSVRQSRQHFAIRALEYLVLTPVVRRRLTEIAMGGVISETANVFERGDLTPWSSPRTLGTSLASQMLRSLLSADDENIETICACICEVLGTAADTEHRLAACYEIAARLPSYAAALGHMPLTQIRKLSKFKDEFIATRKESISAVARKFPSAALLALADGIIAPDDVFLAFGFESLGYAVSPVSFPDHSPGSVIDQIESILNDEQADMMAASLNRICGPIGRWMLCNSPPWPVQGRHLPFGLRAGRIPGRVEEALSEDALFALFALSACRIETEPGFVQERPGFIVSSFPRALLSRSTCMESGVVAEMRASKLSTQAQNAAIAWALWKNHMIERA